MLSPITLHPQCSGKDFVDNSIEKTATNFWNVLVTMKAFIFVTANGAREKVYGGWCCVNMVWLFETPNLRAGG